MNDIIKKVFLLCCFIGFSFEPTLAVEPSTDVHCVGAVDKASNCVFSLAAGICIVAYSLNRKQFQKVINKEYCISVDQDSIDISPVSFAQKTKSYLVKRLNKLFGRYEELSINCNLLDVIVLSSLLSVAIC
jgi:hypothetical protein